MPSIHVLKFLYLFYQIQDQQGLKANNGYRSTHKRTPQIPLLYRDNLLLKYNPDHPPTHKNGTLVLQKQYIILNIHQEC